MDLIETMKSEILYLRMTPEEYKECLEKGSHIALMICILGGKEERVDE